MDVSNLFKEVVKDLKKILKEPKVLILSVIYIVSNSLIFKTYSEIKSYWMLLLTVPLALFIYTYLIEAILNTINTDDKRISSNQEFSVIKKFFRCLSSWVKVRFFTIAIVIIITLFERLIIKLVVQEISMVIKLTGGLIMMGIILIITIRTSLYGSISILGGEKEIIKNSFSLTKGKFWKLIMLNSVPAFLLVLIFIIPKVLDLGVGMSILISLPLGLVSTMLFILVSLNVWYYLKNDDSQMITIVENS